MSGARRVILWVVDQPAGLVRPLAAAGGGRPNAHVLHGSPITWITQQGISARIAPPPEWAETLRVMGIAVIQAQPTHALTLELIDDLDVNPEQFAVLGIYMGALLNVMYDHHLLADYQKRSQLLIDALRALPRANDARALASELTSAAVQMTEGHGAALVIWHGDSGEVVSAEGSGLAAGTTFEDDVESLTVLAARGGATLSHGGAALRALHVLSDGERFLPSPEAAVAIPLIVDDHVIGVLTAWTARSSRISEEAVTTLETIAPYAAVQLRHALELGVMKAIAERDGLTGLANRRAFDTQLLTEWARWERSREPFSLLLFDIDHFKKINDQHGHDAGDEVLRAVGGALHGALRGKDFTARYGGEEFAVLLGEANLKTATEVAERVRAHIERMNAGFAGKHIPVTISGGVASSSEHLSAGDMIRTADRLLYKAKSDGRNRIY
jgi:diguanylate cyclase (GGDEF)-like protein